MQQTQINGNRYSFTSITVQMAGMEQPRAFKSINYDANQDPGKVQTNQVTLAGLTSGYADGSGGFEMLDSELDDFFTALSGGGVFNVMDVDFDIIVNFSANGIDVRQDTLRGCRITKIGASRQNNNEASSTSCELIIRRMYRNGAPLFGEQLAQ
jgi:hypothetical protein